LLYTAITRARRLCVLVGSKRAIGISVSNNKVAQRYTALAWRLQENSRFLLSAELAQAAVPGGEDAAKSISIVFYPSH
jgi:superfamily I DNA/RNA helicase